MQSRQLIAFKLPATVVGARSLTQLARLLKNVPDCNSFSSKLTRLLSAVASGAGTTLCLRGKASNTNTSAAAVALAYLAYLAYLASALLKRTVALMGRSFRRLIDDISDVATDIGFVGLTVMTTP